MNNQLKIKVDDFSKWAINSFDHYYNNRFADALTNMRKSGEAVIKLVITNENFGKTGELKIVQKGYKELISLLIAESIVPRKVINWLETIQIYGNIATHDNKVVFSQAEYGRIALQMLVKWLFEEYLKVNIPENLSNYIEKQWDTKKLRENASILQEELDKSRTKTERLETEQKTHKQQSKENEEKVSILESELNKTKSNTDKELEKSSNIISQFQEKIKDAKKEAEQLKIELKKEKQKSKAEALPVTIPEKKRKLSKKKKIGISIGFVLIISIISLIIFNPFSKTVKEIEKVEPVISKQQQEKPYTVLILPFSVLQDNPNIIVKLEDAILRKLVQRNEDNNLSMQLLYNPEKDKAVISYKQALEVGIKQKANIVIFGEIYEQASGDSVQAIVKYTFVNDDNSEQITGETKKQSFGNLTDIYAGNLQDEIECIIDMAISLNHINKGNYTDALAILTEIDTTAGSYYDANLSYLKAVCYYENREFLKAIQELEETIDFYPDGAHAINLLGMSKLQLDSLDVAEKLLLRAMQIDSNSVEYLLDYINYLSNPGIQNFKKAKELILVALQKDTTVAKAYYFNAEIEVIFNNYKEAEKSYIKALELAPNYLTAKINYANLLANSLNQFEKANLLLQEAIKEDSTNYLPYNMLGRMYLTSRLKNLDKAEYYYKKSIELQNDTLNSTALLGLGVVYHERKDYKTAETYYIRALEANSSNISIYNKLIQLYGETNKMEKVKDYLDKAYLLDSLNANTNINYALFYSIPSNPKYYNEIKGIKYFEKALNQNSSDEFVLESLCDLYYRNEMYVKSKRTCLSLININPDNYEANYHLGLIYGDEKDYKQARKYCEKAISINPKIPEPYVNLSTILMQNGNNISLALEYAQKAVDIGIENADLYFIVSKIFFAGGDINKAKMLYDTALELNPKVKNEEFEKLLYNN